MAADRDTKLKIVAAGVLAPSADNSQPWKFSLSDRGVLIGADPARIGMFFDSALAATQMSLGAVCENMLLEAGRLNLGAQLRPLPAEPGQTLPTYALDLTDDPADRDPLADHIPARMTHRGLYRRRAMPDREALAAIAAALPDPLGCRLDWATGKDARQGLQRAVYLADLVRFTHPTIHRDFHDKLRFGHQAAATRDGLDAATLGIERLLLPILRLLRPWPLAKTLNGVGLKHIMAWRGGWLPMASAPALGVLTARTDVGYFDMGRALERVWLAATRAGLAFQPLGALPLLLVRATRMGGEGLSGEHRHLLEQADQAWRQAVPHLPRGEQLVMIFRTGHAMALAPHSQRRPQASFLA
ncbi:MAG: hypothetical protein AB1899_11460 [Pseudomonadota bacterium]